MAATCAAVAASSALPSCCVASSACLSASCSAATMASCASALCARRGRHLVGQLLGPLPLAARCGLGRRRGLGRRDPRRLGGGGAAGGRLEPPLQLAVLVEPRRAALRGLPPLVAQRLLLAVGPRLRVLQRAGKLGALPLHGRLEALAGAGLELRASGCR